MAPATNKHHIFNPHERTRLEVNMFYGPIGASVRLHHYKVDSTLTGFTDVKPVNLESQVHEQLRHGSVKSVIPPASQIRPWCEFVDKISPVHTGALSSEEQKEKRKKERKTGLKLAMKFTLLWELVRISLPFFLSFFFSFQDFCCYCHL